MSLKMYSKKVVVIYIKTLLVKKNFYKMSFYRLLYWFFKKHTIFRTTVCTKIYFTITIIIVIIISITPWPDIPIISPTPPNTILINGYIYPILSYISSLNLFTSSGCSRYQCDQMDGISSGLRSQQGPS